MVSYQEEQVDFYLNYKTYLSPEGKEKVTQYAKMSLSDLFAEASKKITTTSTIEGEGTEDEFWEENVDISKAGSELYEIYRRLDIINGPTVRALIQKMYEDEVVPLKKKIGDMEAQFKNHRHALDKTYGEKPVW